MFYSEARHDPITPMPTDPRRDGGAPAMHGPCLPSPWRCETMKQRLNSSAIEAVDYDAGTGRMRLWFPANGPYSFYRVPEEIYLRLINSHSKGSYYNNHIRGRYSRP